MVPYLLSVQYFHTFLPAVQLLEKYVYCILRSKLVDAPKSLYNEQPMFLPLGPSDVKMVCAISSIAAGPKMEMTEWIM